MKQVKINDKKKRFGRGLSSKGFYIALAICLVGSGIMAFVAVDRTLSGIEDMNSGSSSLSQQEPSSSSQVGAVTDKPAGSSSSSSNTEQQSSSQSSSSASESTAAATVVYSLPVSGEIMNAYSAGELVKSLTLGDWRTHDGVDIKADAGTEVHPAGAGTVKKVYSDTMWGNCVEIEHADGLISVYCSLSEPTVQVGQAVDTGTVIGTVTDSAEAEVLEASHLHFGMKQDGNWIDPMSKISD